MSMVARVTMKGGIFTLPMSIPLKKPSTQPTASTVSSVTKTELVALKATTPRPPIIASMEPTERSMPPVMMTRPMPKAMMPTTAEWRSMFITPLNVVAPPLMIR